MVLPAAPIPAPGAGVPCALDRHAGPFEPVEELRGRLGTDWYRCRCCRALVTRLHAGPERAAA
jgi:hypothetical protein